MRIGQGNRHLSLIPADVDIIRGTIRFTRRIIPITIEIAERDERIAAFLHVTERVVRFGRLIGVAEVIREPLTRCRWLGRPRDAEVAMRQVINLQHRCALSIDIVLIIRYVDYAKLVIHCVVIQAHFARHIIDRTNHVARQTIVSGIDQVTHEGRIIAITISEIILPVHILCNRHPLLASRGINKRTTLILNSHTH